LFVNGESRGVKQRNSQDFPAAGLRWQVAFQPGENHVRVVARKAGVEVADEISFRYQTEKWDNPAQLAIEETGRAGAIVTLLARLLDARSVPCLDARNVIRFRLAGDGELIQNLGITSGSRQVEMANGRAVVRVRMAKGEAVLSAAVEGVSTALHTIRA
jgi:beta-galactosidase